MDEDEELPQELLLASAELAVFILKWIPLDKQDAASKDLSKLVDRHLMYYLEWKRKREEKLERSAATETVN